MNRFPFIRFVITFFFINLLAACSGIDQNLTENYVLADQQREVLENRKYIGALAMVGATKAGQQSDGTYVSCHQMSTMMLCGSGNPNCNSSTWHCRRKHTKISPSDPCEQLLNVVRADDLR